MTLEFPHLRTGMVFLLITIAAILIVILTKRMHNLRSNINLDDLLIDPATNRISKAAFVLLASFLLSSWVILYLTLTGKLTDVLFSAYLVAYATPAVTKIITDSRGAATGPSP